VVVPQPPPPQDCGDDDDDMLHDPILQAVLQQKTSERGTNNDNTLRTKNPHRFMQDIDERISMPLEIEETQPLVPPPDAVESSVTFRATPWFNWAGKWSSAPPLKPETIRGPLSRRDVESGNQIKEEKFAMVDSSAMLSADELQTLAQLKAASSESGTTNTSQLLCMLYQVYPRESFVVVTFILAVLAYFYGQFHAAPEP
jgi:hypothetical protein